MKRLLSSVVAGAIFATVALPVTPAFADRKRDQYIENFYKKNKRDNNYARWERDRRNWRDDDYRRWYRDHHRDNDDAIAAGIFGLAAGAIIGGAIANSGGVVGSSHVAACEARYRSYDPVSDTYLGYDGYRHPCRL